jgi:hypothetical protein
MWGMTVRCMMTGAPPRPCLERAEGHGALALAHLRLRRVHDEVAEDQPRRAPGSFRTSRVCSLKKQVQLTINLSRANTLAAAGSFTTSNRPR